MIQQVVFLVLAVVTLGAAIAVVTARSVFASALWLVLSLIGVAGLYVLLDAAFLAVVQVLVYVGAISVLVLFAIMLTRDIMTDRRAVNAQWAVGAAIALCVFAALAVVGRQAAWQTNHAAVPPPSGGVVVASAELPDPALAPGAMAREDADGSTIVVTGPTAALGRAFVTDYLLAFEVAGALLLVVLVGAIVIARE